MRSIRIVSIGLLLGGLAAYAQVNTAMVLGTVTDPSHAQVPGAQAKLENVLTGASLTAISNETGQFTFNFVPIGRYNLTVQSAGFQPQSRHDLILSAGDTVSLNFQLEVSTAQQSVLVTGEQPLIDAATSEQHDTIAAKDVTELPLSKQDWTGLLKLGTGISKAGNGGVTLNGLPPAAFNLTVDGTNASLDPELPSLGFYQSFNVINSVNNDAIQEVSTTKGIAPASVAGSMSGNVNIITKSGTNQFHGSLFEFNSVAAYNARNQFLTRNPGSTFNQFGGSLGGRILRDRLFFFGDYEGVRTRNFTAVSDDVPTPEFIAQTLAVAPLYKSVFSAFPAPNQPYAAGAQTGRYIGAGSLKQDDENMVGRLDWYLNQNNMLTVRYTRSRPMKDQPRVIAVNPRVTTGHSDVYNWQFTHSAASWTAVTRFGYNRQYLNRLDEGFGVNLDQVKFGFDSQGAEAYQKVGNTQTWEENIGLNHGRHSIQLGGIVQRQNSGRIDDTTNTFSYASLSDFLADIPNQIQVNFPLLPFQLHEYQFGGFVQDDYRVRPNLTLNLGIRYDYWTVPKERDGRVFNRAPNALGPGFGPFRPASSMYDAYYPNFSPRVGFAWGVGSDRKTVVRGGVGYFFNPHPIFGGPIDMPLTAPNVPFRLTLSRAQALGLGLKFPVDTMALLAQLQASGAPIANPSINPYFPNPSSAQWTLDVQRELGHGFVLDTGYVGNRAVHLNMIRQENLPDRATGIAPNPALGQFRYYDGSDNSKYNAWQTNIQKRFASGLSLSAAYTWANNMSLGDGDLQLQTPAQDNYNLRADWAPTPYAIRHSFNSSFVYELPFLRLAGASGRAAKLALGGWQISGILTAATGPVVNITDGKSSYPNSRPDLNAGVHAILDDYTGTLNYLTRAAFTTVPILKASGASARPGDLGRNALTAPGAWNLDASFAKNLPFTEGFNLQLRGDFFNALNHTNLGGLVSDLSKSSFGRLTSATARTAQIGARLVF